MPARTTTQAAAEELLARDYPTRSVFNWRTPLPMWLIGNMPAIVLGKMLLLGLALAVLLMAFEAMRREEPEHLPAGHAAGRAADRAAVALHDRDDLFVMPVFWAGTLIALSICAYGVNRPGAGRGGRAGRRLLPRAGPALLRLGRRPGLLAAAAGRTGRVARRDWPPGPSFSACTAGGRQPA